MQNRRLTHLISLIIAIAFCFYTDSGYSRAEEVEQARGAETIHIIKKSDTLWNISEEYLKNPFLWPYVWSNNNYIKNPDLIYPGKRLIIPPFVMPEPVEEAVTPPPAPVVSMVVEPPPLIPFIGAEIIEKGGYIIEHIESYGIIRGSETGRNIYATGDTVNILLHDIEEGEVSVGDKFTIFKEPVNVTHPKTRRRVGKLFIPVGVLELTRVLGRDAAGRIIKSYATSSPGDHIQPYRETSPATEIKESIPGIDGFIIEAKEGRALNAEHSIVYLDRGAIDGVAPGTTSHVIGKRPDDIIGELKVISVQETTSTALVTKSTGSLGRGSRILTTAK